MTTKAECVPSSSAVHTLNCQSIAEEPATALDTLYAKSTPQEDEVS